MKELTYFKFETGSVLNYEACSANFSYLEVGTYILTYLPAVVNNNPSAINVHNTSNAITID